MTDLRCVVEVYRGEWITLHRELCNKPAKGSRKTPDGRVWPVCGIHLRHGGLVETELGRYWGLAL